MADATSQPTGAVVINTANPITLGLVFAEYPPVSGRDSISTPFGTAYDGAPASAAGFTSLGPNYAGTSGMTILAVGYRASTADTGSRKYLARIRQSSNANVEQFALGLGDFSNNRSPRIALRLNSGTLVEAEGGATYLPVVDNSQIIMGGVYTRNSASGLKFFVNGSVVSTQSTPDVPVFDVATDFFASDQTGGGNNSALPATMVAFWIRSLSDAEMADLMANPWQIFLDSAGAPPAGTVTIDTIVPGSTSAVVPYTYSAGDATGFEQRLDGGTPAAIGASPATITGLTASTTYDIEVRAINADGNGAWSAVESFTTTTPELDEPNLSTPVGTVKSNSLIVIGATTDEANGTMYVVVTTSATAPSAAQVKLGQNNGGTAAVFAANQSISSTGAKTFNATGFTQLTGYYPYIVHTDAAGNDSSVLSVGLRTTFRNGATGQAIIDNTGPVGGNPAGAHYNKVVLPADADKWFASREITPPATGVLTFNPDGTLIFIGPNYETTTRQLEVDGVDTPPGTPWTISLYDITSQVATPGNVTSVVTVTPSACTQGFIATPGPVTSLVSVTPSACTQTLPAAVATPLNLTSIVTVSPSFVRVLTLDPSANRLRMPADGNTRRYLGKFFKRPVEMDDYDVEAADYLATIEDTLISAEVTADAGITVDAFRLVGSFVKVWVSGGVKRGRYKLTVRVTTAEGRIKELKFMVVMPAG